MIEFESDVIEATISTIGCSKEVAIVILKEMERQKLIMLKVILIDE